MYTRGLGQDYGPTLEQLGAEPPLGPGSPSPNNPLSASGQSTMSGSALDLFSQLNTQYFGGSSTSTGQTFTQWINANATYVIIGGAALLALFVMGGGRRR